MKNHRLLFGLSFLTLLFLAAGLHRILWERSKVSILKETSIESQEFRKQQLKPELYEILCEQRRKGQDFGALLTATMLAGKYAPEKVWGHPELFLKYKEESFLQLKKGYEAVWADLICFPVPDSSVKFENTWMEPRAYGGKRVHEGTDLFGTVTTPGYYPVLSMTDGVVEQKGWLPLGGYRIGIRSPHGGYFYYAHLFDYERDFQKGEQVKAGEILGYMGNSGYGPEGTSGVFPVHLHLGIYIAAPHTPEISVNPYWVLQALRKNIRKYTY